MTHTANQTPMCIEKSSYDATNEEKVEYRDTKTFCSCLLFVPEIGRGANLFKDLWIW